MIKRDEIKELQSQLRNGDRLIISEIVGCNAVQVRQVMRGAYPAHTPTAQKIIAAARQIIESRELIKDQFKKV